MLLVTTGAACTSAESSGDCTSIGCSDGLTVTFREAKWLEGDYVVKVRADQRTVTCTGALPLPPCGTPALSCDGLGVAISESGCALPPEQQAFDEIRIDASPAEVEVSLDFAGKTVVIDTATPAYRSLRPNGPECEPVCKQGATNMKVPELRRVLPKPRPEPERERVGSTTACLAPAPALPTGLLPEARTCLEGLIAARSRFGFAEPPTTETAPCAIDEVDEDGTIFRSGRVVRASGPKPEVVFDFADPDDGERTVITETRFRDAKGRDKKVVRLSEQLFDAGGNAACRNPTTSQHQRDRNGWPTTTKKVIETCEGVDSGTFSTERTFKAEVGFVSAAVITRDGDAPVITSGWWLPDPADPLAFGSTKESGETSCSLRVLGCDGAELGKLDGGDHLSARRNRFECGAEASP